MYILIKGAALEQYFKALGFNSENILFPYALNKDHITIIDKIIKLLSSYTEVSYEECPKTKSCTHHRNSKNATARRMQRRGLFYILLSELFKLHEINSESNTSPVSKKEYIRKATQHIEANYSSELNVDKIAAKLGLNRSYLYKIFKTELGISVQDYIIQTRIRVSCSLLKSTDISIKSIALSVNYDPITFSRIFKKHIGITPLQYRKENVSSKQQRFL